VFDDDEENSDLEDEQEDGEGQGGEEEDDDEGEAEISEDQEAKRAKFEEMTYAEREMYHNKMKERLAEVANQIIENPEERVALLGHFQEIYDEPSITVKKLCLLTQFAIFRDILPG
jgi:nucleolar complex protein 3